MNNVVALNPPVTGSAQARERFEKWAGTDLTKIERETFFARTVGGEYVRPSMRMAWAAWQGGIQDLIEQYHRSLSSIG